MARAVIVYHSGYAMAQSRPGPWHGGRDNNGQGSVNDLNRLGFPAP